MPENHKEEVPFAHYAALFSALDPRDAQARLGEEVWDGEKYYVSLLGQRYALTPEPYALEPLDGGKTPPLPAQTFLLRYLLEGQVLPWLGQWKTFREMPWGERYIQPYTGRVLTRAAFTFATRLPAFRKAAQAAGGEPTGHGDAGYQFQLIGPYQMQLLLWAGDEEFPPSAQVLYSDNFSSGFAAEDRVVAGDLLISHIKSFM